MTTKVKYDRRRNAVGWWKGITDEQKALAEKIVTAGCRIVEAMDNVQNFMFFSAVLHAGVEFGACRKEGDTTLINRGFKKVIAFAFHRIVDVSPRPRGKRREAI